MCSIGQRKAIGFRLAALQAAQPSAALLARRDAITPSAVLAVLASPRARRWRAGFVLRTTRRRSLVPAASEKEGAMGDHVTGASHSKAVVKTSERRGQHKFHKLFNLDGSEPLLKSFPCALVGDILFQGTFYASEHFFCFHSKFAKKRKLIQVAVREVTNLTREKTAGIIPNAIALHTKHSRFVFASIIGRENIFRLLCNMWQSQVSASNTQTWVSNDGVLHDSSADTDGETEEEIELDVQDELDIPCLPDKPQGTDQPDSTPLTLPARSDSPDIPNTSFSSALSAPMGRYLRGVFGLPKAQLCLLIAYIVLIFLAFSAVVLAWRIYSYQTFLVSRLEQMDGFNSRMAPFCSADDHDCNLYRLRQQAHSTRIRHVHAVMSSNIKTLADLAQKLRGSPPASPSSPSSPSSSTDAASRDRKDAADTIVT